MVYGGNAHPPAIESAGPDKPPPKDARASGLPDLTMIGKLLGHRQVQTTARHTHLARESVKASAATVAGSFAVDMDEREQDRPMPFEANAVVAETVENARDLA